MQHKIKLRRLGIEVLEQRELLTALVKVTNTTTFPASATVSIEQTYDTNNNGYKDSSDPTYICSGGMIGKHYAVTAAHCLYDSSRGGFPEWVTVRPGRTPSSSPYGSATATILGVPSAYTHGNYLADIGVMKLGSNLGTSTGWYGMRVATTSELTNKVLNLRHYPGSPKSDGTQQYYSSGRAAKVTAGVISYKHSVISTFPGSSGAPLYFGDTRQIVGIHVRGALGSSGVLNESTRLTTSFFNMIQDFKSRHQSDPLDQAQGGDRAIGEIIPDGSTQSPDGVTTHRLFLQLASVPTSSKIALTTPRLQPVSVASTVPAVFDDAVGKGPENHDDRQETVESSSVRNKQGRELEVNRYGVDELFSLNDFPACVK